MNFLVPSWNCPASVRSLITTRTGGVSVGAYASLNLARHTGDHEDHVRQNRRLVQDSQGWAKEPLWLNQVHGTLIVSVQENTHYELPTADGAVTRVKGQPLVVLTADCLPILACDRAGSIVGAFHGGWRGLADGILERAVGAMETAPEDLIFWIGPGIGQSFYQVGEEVWSAFRRQDDGHRENFKADGPGRWLFDLSGAAALQLRNLGVAEIYQAPWETSRNEDLFFSHRRENPCGRMGTFIVLE